jgi:hypothetical protein
MDAISPVKTRSQAIFRTRRVPRPSFAFFAKEGGAFDSPPLSTQPRLPKNLSFRRRVYRRGITAVSHTSFTPTPLAHSPSIPYSFILMHRLTARLLLILLLVSIIAPTALAITAPTPHACCLRMKHDCTATSSSRQFQAPPTCCNRDCCRPLTISQWGENPRSNAAAIIPASSILSSTRRSILRADECNESHSGRAPPKFSIA